jgi:hypothetical protein
MKVLVHIMFRSPNEDDRETMRAVARALTNYPESVVVLEEKPHWLVVEFSMPTEAQYKAVRTIESAIRKYAYDCMDSIIEFPMSEDDREQNRRKAERRRAPARSRSR